MEIALRRNNEHVIGLKDQTFRDEFNRHFGVVRENFMELGGDDSQMIDDDDRCANIWWQAL